MNKYLFLKNNLKEKYYKLISHKIIIKKSRGYPCGFHSTNKMKRGNRAQVWIETVMYTLIAFAIMGLVLAYARPEIEKLQDKAIIEQSILMLNGIDNTLLNMGGSGNQRTIEISIKKGDLKIDGKDDKIIFEMESRLQYSEPEKIISNGNVEILTKKSGKFNLITLTRDFYNNYNITYTKRDEIRTISRAPVAYTLKISNRGTETYSIPDPCDSQSDPCSDIPLFNAECVGTPPSAYCEYTSERPTIDFELL